MSKRLESGAREVELQVASHYLVRQAANPRQAGVQAEHFTDARLSAAWGAAVAKRDGWTPFDILNPEQVVELSDVPSLAPWQVEAHEQRMVERWARWHLARETGRVYDDLKTGKIDVEEGASQLKRAAGEAAAGSSIPVVTLQEAGLALVDRWSESFAEDEEKPTATIPMPLRRLQERIGGWARGKLWEIGACTSHHKTTLATMALQHAAERGYRVLGYMLEDDAFAVASRILSRKIGWIDTRALLMGARESKGEPLRVSDVRQAAHQVLTQDWTKRVRLISETRPPLSRVMHTIGREAARGVDLVVLDYLQLIRPDRRGPVDHEHWDEVGGALQGLAKELDIAIVATVQPTQSAQKDQEAYGRRLALADLKGGQAISASAWGVLLIDADGIEENDERGRRTGWTRNRRAIRIQVAKNKSGPTTGGRFSVIPENDLITDEEPT